MVREIVIDKCFMTIKSTLNVHPRFLNFWLDDRFFNWHSIQAILCWFQSFSRVLLFYEMFFVNEILTSLETRGLAYLLKE